MPQEPPADVQAAFAHGLAAREQRHVGGAAADIQVEHPPALFLGELRGTGAASGQDALQRGAGRGDHELARQL